MPFKSELSNTNKRMNPLASRIWRTGVFSSPSVSRRTAHVLSFLSILQIICVAVDASFHSFEEEDNALMGPALEYFHKTINVRKVLSIRDSEGIEPFILATFAIYMLLPTILLIFLGYSLAMNQKLWRPVKKAYKRVGYIHTFLFSLPVYSLTIGTIFRLLRYDQLSNPEIAMLIAAFFFLIINSLFSSSHIFLSVLVKSQNPFSRTSHVYLWVDQLLKFVMTLLLNVGRKHQEGTSYSLNVVGILFSTVQIAEILISMPFFKHRLNRRLMVGQIVAWLIYLLNMLCLSIAGRDKFDLLYTLTLFIAPLLCKWMLNFYETKQKKVDFFKEKNQAKFRGDQTFVRTYMH